MIWLLLHWKLVALAGAAGLIGLALLAPATLKLLWRKRVALGVVVALFVSHGAVAVGAKKYFSQAAEVARLTRERDAERAAAESAAADLAATLEHLRLTRQREAARHTETLALEGRIDALNKQLEAEAAADPAGGNPPDRITPRRRQRLYDAWGIGPGD